MKDIIEKWREFKIYWNKYFSYKAPTFGDFMDWLSENSLLIGEGKV